MAIAAAVPYLLAATAAISAYSAIAAGQAGRASARYNAQVNEQNAQLARAEASQLVAQQDRENYLRLGAIRAAQGKGGGAAGEGSVLDVIGDVAAQGELDKQMILFRGALKGRGYGNTSTLDRLQGNQAQSAGYLRAGSELLRGASDYNLYGMKLKPSASVSDIAT